MDEIMFRFVDRGRTGGKEGGALRRRPSRKMQMTGLSGLIIAIFGFCLWGFLDSNGETGLRSFSAAHAQEKTKRASIIKLRIEPLYRAARLTWKTTIRRAGRLNFDVYRSMATPDGPYTLMASVEWRAGRKKYRYVDKNLPVEENYFYKIEIPTTGESFGPLQVRPPFSLPTTRRESKEAINGAV